MFTLISDIGRIAFWAARWVFGILLILWLGWLVKTQLNELDALESSVQYLKNGELQLRSELSELSAQTKQSLTRLKRATAAQLDRRISELTQKIESKNQQLLELDSMLTKLNPAKQLDVARLKIEIGLATQELERLHDLKKVSAQSSKIGMLAEDCTKIHRQHVGEWNAYQGTVARLRAFNASSSRFFQWIPLSDGFRTRQTLEAERDTHAINTQKLKSQHAECLADQAAAKRVLNDLVKEKVSAQKNPQAEKALAELNDHIQALQGDADKHWFKSLLLDPGKQLLPTAAYTFMVLLSGFIATKLGLYFVLTPLAGRQAPICLQPNARSPANVPSSKSAVSLSIPVAPDSELLVRPSYFHSAPDYCSTSLKLFLNNHFIMTSLAARMYKLTAVHGQRPFVAVVSAGQDSLAELLQFEVGEGEAVCIRPSNLVGIIQKRSSAVHITRHWRLANLQAWLTLQLRYLVFHGPVTIIVKGCRGARAVSVTEGRAIDQVSTIGFSADLNYSISRTETFLPYMTCEKRLLRDRFSGQSGFYIFEEMPTSSKRSHLKGRGIVGGVSDAVLKLFGV